jgi:hypothetical protein
MIALLRIAPLLLLFALHMAGRAAAAEATWQSFDTLGGVDRALAEAALADMFGDDPELWPDWLDPGAVLIPAGNERSLLVVRQPYRAPCGPYLFIVFGPAGGAAGRERLGPGFCAGELLVSPVRGQSLPDLTFLEGRQQDPADGLWRRVDQRVRWSDTGWLRIIEK